MSSNEYNDGIEYELLTQSIYREIHRRDNNNIEVERKLH